MKRTRTVLCVRARRPNRYGGIKSDFFGGSGHFGNGNRSTMVTNDFQCVRNVFVYGLFKSKRKIHVGKMPVYRPNSYAVRPVPDVEIFANVRCDSEKPVFNDDLTNHSMYSAERPFEDIRKILTCPFRVHIPLSSSWTIFFFFYHRLVKFYFTYRYSASKTWLNHNSHSGLKLVRMEPDVGVYNIIRYLKTICKF